MWIEARKLESKNVIIPYENRLEAGIVEEINIIPAKDLASVVSHLNGSQTIPQFTTSKDEILLSSNKSNVDFSEVKGQENVKRALEIAAAGGHNCLLIGSPGSGKTMLSRRLPTILPDLTFEEALEISKIHSIAGTLPSENSLINVRPFRAPHHTVSATALTGGGRIPKPRRNKSRPSWSTFLR